MKLFARIQEKVSSWRLPVRIPVPNRDNLIAMGLMALSLGLMVGVAIGPALGAASNAVAGVVAPLTAAPPAEPETETVTDSPTGVELGSPAGSEPAGSSTVADTSGSPGDSGDGSTSSGTTYPDTDYSAPDDETEEIPAKIETPPDTDEEGPEGTELKGTTVGVDPQGGGYDIADSSGNVLALHASEPPAIGEGVETLIDPLANGTFAEVGDRKVAGLKTRSKLRGTASWVDPVAKLVVISSRGSSLAVDLGGLPEEQALGIQVGSPIESVVLIGEPAVSEDGLTIRPGLAAESLKTTGEPLESFDLNGTITAVGEGANGRQLTVAADGAGLIPSEIVVEAPKSFDPALVTTGKTHNLSVERDAAGILKLTGLSPDYNEKVAADSAAAFGTHA